MATPLHNLANLAASRSLGLSGLLIIATAMLATFGWHGFHFFNTFQQEDLTAKSKPSADQLPPDKTVLSKSLINVFGDNRMSTKEPQERLENLPESNLNLQVSAIFFMATPGQSSVILEDGSKTLMLKPGEEARPGVSVQSIESSRITLKRNGKLEQISFRGFAEAADGNSQVSDLPSNSNAPTSELASSEPPSNSPTAAEPSAPTAYQQFIQRKLAQNNK